MDDDGDAKRSIADGAAGTSDVSEDAATAGWARARAGTSRVAARLDNSDNSG